MTKKFCVWFIATVLGVFFGEWVYAPELDWITFAKGAITAVIVTTLFWSTIFAAYTEA